MTPDEQRQVQAGLRSSDAFVLRRCQILLASARGGRAPAIAHHLGCDDQTVRNVIHDLNTEGLAVLQEGSSRPHRLRTTFTQDKAEPLARPAAPQSPRLWQRPRAVDVGLGHPGQCRARHSLEPGLRRECAPRPQTPGHEPEARQALDHQPRSAVPTKKTHETV